MSRSAKKGLGRGLDSLLPGFGADLGAGGESTLRLIAVDRLRPGRFQARAEMDAQALEELSRSIAQEGVIQPLVARAADAEGMHELIAGERRWRAAKMAGLSEVPAVVRDVDDKTAMMLGLAENMQRQNLNPIDEARGLKRLADEFGMNAEGIANALGRPRSTVSNALRLLNLEPEAQKLLADRRLGAGHGKALLALGAQEQVRLAGLAAENGWSVREVERRVKEMRGGFGEPDAAGGSGALGALGASGSEAAAQAALEAPAPEADDAGFEYVLGDDSEDAPAAEASGKKGASGRPVRELGPEEQAEAALLQRAQDAVRDRFALEATFRRAGPAKGALTVKWDGLEQFDRLMKMLGVAPEEL